MERTTKESTALAPSTMKNKRLECEIKVLLRSVARKCSPACIGMEASGIHDTSFHCLLKCDDDLRKNLHAMLCCLSTRQFSEGLTSMNPYSVYELVRLPGAETEIPGPVVSHRRQLHQEPFPHRASGYGANFRTKCGHSRFGESALFEFF